MSFGAGGSAGPTDWLTAGPPPTPPGRRRRGLLAVMLLVAVVALVLGPALWVRQRQVDPGPSIPTTTPTPSATSRRSLPTARPSPTDPRPVVVRHSGPLLPDLDSDWDLFARTDDTIYRIEVRTGRVTATPLGSLGTTGPVTFLADAHGVILRPMDHVRGIAVPDGRPAQALRGRLALGGYTLPGPPGLVWVDSQQTRTGQTTAMRLVRFDGTDTQTVVRTGTGHLRSDGAGGLLLDDVGGVWEARPDGMRRITTGGIVAVGPQHYLVVRCDARHACRSSLYDRQDREERRLDIRYPSRWFSGVLSPSGRLAAFLTYQEPEAQMTLEVIDLRSDRTLARLTAPEQSEVDPLWSPDGRWLAVLVAGRLTFVDLGTGELVTPRLRLPDLLQLTGRTGS